MINLLVFFKSHLIKFQIHSEKLITLKKLSLEFLNHKFTLFRESRDSVGKMDFEFIGHKFSVTKSIWSKCLILVAIIGYYRVHGIHLYSCEYKTKDMSWSISLSGHALRRVGYNVSHYFNEYEFLEEMRMRKWELLLLVHFMMKTYLSIFYLQK